MKVHNLRKKMSNLSSSFSTIYLTMAISSNRLIYPEQLQVPIREGKMRQISPLYSPSSSPPPPPPPVTILLFMESAATKLNWLQACLALSLKEAPHPLSDKILGPRKWHLHYYILADAHWSHNTLTSSLKTFGACRSSSVTGEEQLAFNIVKNFEKISPTADVLRGSRSLARSSLLSWITSYLSCPKTGH